MTHRNFERDPDPFSLTIAVIAAAFGGAAYLEARRLRRSTADEARTRFRGTWRNARDALDRFERQVARFGEFMAEEQFQDEAVRFGGTQLLVEPARKDDVRALQRQTLTTGSFLTKYLDELSNHLGNEYDQLIARTRGRLAEVGTLPSVYGAVPQQAAAAIDAYRRLLDEIERREAFTY
jgi:hypothetical protein